jgi:hypothetical protein
MPVQEHDRRSAPTATEEHAGFTQFDRLFDEPLEHASTLSMRPVPADRLHFGPRRGMMDMGRAFHAYANAYTRQ